MTDKIKVGVVGGSAERGWALWTHRPALASSPDFEVVALAASSTDKAAQAAAVWGGVRAYGNPHDLIADPDVDLVVLAVPLIRRPGLVEEAIAARRHVYCEWPLASSGAEADGFVKLADAAGVRHAVGLQTRHHPQVRRLRDLLAEGWAGEPLSVAFAYALSTPDTWPPRHAPLINTKAVSRLYVVGGHALDLLRRVAGDFTELSAILATRLPVAVLAGTGERLPIETPDQIAVTGVLASGAVASVHITTGSPKGAGYRLEIHGTAGRLVLVSADDSLVGPQFTLLGSQGDEQLRELPLPQGYAQDLPDVPVTVSNVHRVYTDLARGVRGELPSGSDVVTFATGAEVHRLLDAIETSAETGRRVRLN